MKYFKEFIKDTWWIWILTFMFLGGLYYLTDYQYIKNHIPEDVNHDGMVDTRDLLQVKEYILGDED